MAGREKVLLMGKSGSGKTSMRSIIFANYLARDTSRMGPTLEIDHNTVQFMGGMRLNLWDCGGQKRYLQNFLFGQRRLVFGNVKVLIYVFDVNVMSHDAAEEDGLLNSIQIYTKCLEALRDQSKEAKVFVLIHKMDLIPEKARDQVFESRKRRVQEVSDGFDVDYFRTSIWDESLYRAWSTIVYSLVPNIALVEAHLNRLCRICGADEAVLFERATYLVIAKATLRPHGDRCRFEKISNIIKQFKLACSKTKASFEAMLVNNSSFTAFVDAFTADTTIMLIMSDQSVYPAVTQTNIRLGRKHFEKIIKRSTQQLEQ
jgi:Ras-related GTP-binding protein A/B